MEGWQGYLEEHRERFVEELRELLRIPSISALPEHAADVRRAAEWAAERLRAAGLEGVGVLPTEGHPMVYGEWLHAPGRPTALIYGHLDVQPVDPVHLWTTPPFEPTIREGRVYARGAADNKGNLMAPIAAVEALLQTEGALPINAKFLLECQEEIGSPYTPAFVDAQRERLACDLILNADGGQLSETEAAILVGLRGICALEVHVHGPDHDLHSGSFGGAVHNPLHALAELIASLHAPDGRVAVAGFYDDVEPLTPEARNRIADVPFDEEGLKREVGVQALYGEAGYTPRERTWIRPTLEINGMWGGFQGQGTKTVLPAEAQAKITCRLVPDQEPERIQGLVADHLARRAPAGVRLVIDRERSAGRPYRVPADHPGNLAVAEVLTELYGQAPYEMRMGGSVPICEVFLRYLGAYAISFAFGLPDERVHSPNEFFRLASFSRAQEGYVRLLKRLASA